MILMIYYFTKQCWTKRRIIWCLASWSLNNPKNKLNELVVNNCEMKYLIPLMWKFKVTSWQIVEVSHHFFYEIIQDKVGKIIQSVFEHLLSGESLLSYGTPSGCCGCGGGCMGPSQIASWSSISANATRVRIFAG